MVLSREFIGLQAAVAGRYSIDQEIGRGGMGIVYRAKDVTLDRLVAIKLLPPGQAERPDVHRRFLHEARTAARLSHPNIVPIFSVEEARGFVFFVMAYVDGETLTERIARGGPLHPREAIRIFREVAWALGYAHAQQVVHRDVKPDNIMIERGSGRALVMDFGIAGDGTDEFGGVIGTPHFMSPEQAAGEPLEPTTDVYSFGATMFFAMSGQPPFDGDDAPTVLAHHIRTSPARLSQIAPGTPTKVSGLVETCLMKEPNDRFQRAEELADQLDRAMETSREVPVAVRAFVTRAREQRSGLVGLLAVYMLAMLLPAFGGLFGYPGAFVAWLGVAAAAAITPFAIGGHRARKLLSAGFDRTDLIRALEEDYRQRAEELPFIYGDGNERVVGQLRNTSNVLLGGALAMFAFGMSAMTIPSLGWLLPASLLTGVGGLLLRPVIRRRSAGQEHVRLRRWRGWFGKLVFKLAGWRMTKVSDASRLTYRPTEMAVGTAVLGLFEALPKATREALGDLPEVVAGLERDAQRMRNEVNQYDKLLADADRDADREHLQDESITGQRVRAVAQIQSARDAAAARLSDAVAALETLRVDLLRIRAGEIALDGVTENLGAAREIAEQVERIVSAQDELA